MARRPSRNALLKRVGANRLIACLLSARYGPFLKRSRNRFRPFTAAQKTVDQFHRRAMLSQGVANIKSAIQRCFYSTDQASLVIVGNTNFSSLGINTAPASYR